MSEPLTGAEIERLRAWNDFTPAPMYAEMVLRLLNEVERHRLNLQALESNLVHHPGSMTTERILGAVRAAQELMWLETLT